MALTREQKAAAATEIPYPPVSQVVTVDLQYVGTSRSTGRIRDMSAGQNIGDREREILTAIVETFISTGEPVGSRMLSRGSREGLSPATIRNVMADLVDSGYLEQPHTSAGRVPSPAAYRYYVEQLSGKTQISKTDAGIIQDSLQGVTDVQEFMERTSHVLSLISRNVGVAVAASGPKNALEHVYFSRLGDQKVLAVVVTKSGLVRDRVMRLDLPQSDLDAAARYINDNFRGWTLEKVRHEIAHRLEKERSEYDGLMASVEQLYKQGVLSGDESAQVVFIEGTANLVAGEQDRKRLQELLQALDEKQKLVELLGAYLDAKQEAVRVVIGLDEATPSMRNLVLIGTPARVGGEVMGSLAVLGPTRMDYQNTITAVSYIARLFDKILNESE
jgi:heat-inducible transcriptional repressor